MWLEVVELRAVNGNKGIICQLIYQLLNKNQKINSAKIYVSERIESDWSIQIQNKSEKINPRGTELGLQLVDILRDFGLVNHNILVELNLLNTERKEM
jgi:hypothetical protein